MNQEIQYIIVVDGQSYVRKTTPERLPLKGSIIQDFDNGDGVSQTLRVLNVQLEDDAEAICFCEQIFG